MYSSWINKNKYMDIWYNVSNWVPNDFILVFLPAYVAFPLNVAFPLDTFWDVHGILTDVHVNDSCEYQSQ